MEIDDVVTRLMLGDDKATCTVLWFAEAHDGPGWYYVDDEYPEEGSVGAFATSAEAMEHAIEGEYVPTLGNDDTTAIQRGIDEARMPPPSEVHGMPDESDKGSQP